MSVLCNAVTINRLKQKNVVITGSTKGFGKALAVEFLKRGDNVIINSRNSDNLYIAYDELTEYVNKNTLNFVLGDISNTNDVEYLIEYSKETLGQIDIWINNAGTCAYKRQRLPNFTDHELNTIVSTNLIGTMLCTKNILNVMKTQETGGLIVNIEGAGANGDQTPGYSIYGGTKAAIRQFTKTIQDENKYENIDIIALSPGMMVTDLIKSDMDENMKTVFNIFCETPERVATEMVSIMRKDKTIKNTRFISYLNLPRIIVKLCFSIFKKKKF